MGMYDNFRSFYKDVPNGDWQTKSLERSLRTYTLQKTGVLTYTESGDYWDYPSLYTGCVEIHDWNREKQQMERYHLLFSKGKLLASVCITNDEASAT